MKILGDNKMNKSYYERYCDNIEKVENYEKAKADNFVGWNCHHRLETHNSDGERRLVDLTSTELKALDMYYNRPVSELIFLTSAEHRRLHLKGKPSPNKGKTMSEESKAKMSAAKKGKVMSEEQKAKLSAAMKGKNKGKTMSEEQKAKISVAMKGKTLSEEHKTKLSAAHKGKNNPMYGQKHSEESKRKISEAQKGMRKGKHWKLVDGKRVWY